MARNAPPVYLDHHATTPVDARVAAAMRPYFAQHFGNPASETHRYGWQAQAAVEAAQAGLAAACGADEVVFTSGATESNNLALQGAWHAAGGAKNAGRILVSAVEHPAVLECAAALSRQGARVVQVPVSAGGIVQLEALEAALGEGALLLSVMAANGEQGALQPLAQIGELAAKYGAFFHCDAAQGFGQAPLNMRELGVDLLSLSAHKMYGPKGGGALLLRRRSAGGRRVKLAPLLHGGGQQRGLRPGTLAVPGIAGLARAAELALAEGAADAARMAELRAKLFAALESCGAQLNGPPFGAARLAGNLNVSFEGLSAEALLAGVPGVAFSAGSACASGSGAPSHVLQACGLPPERIKGAVRFGLGRFTTAAEISAAADLITAEVTRLRAG